MNRESDRFQMTKELGCRLRDLLVQTGLTRNGPDRQQRRKLPRVRARPPSFQFAGCSS